ncbi:ATP-binding protein [Nesterenkonia ebinurensis]|uniref:ATP-binding protein n=1 Tax=Nesterenkonia ebinurensis TaxID=2608252 RepID=UPI00295E75A4|nr:AAA family ATPase [Nesterenkonia ebinurensis]
MDMLYSRRSVDDLLDVLVQEAPAIALDGPKGVGKTMTASRRAQHVWNMEIPEHREHVIADRTLESLPEGVLFIDEWQNYPDSWNAVRRAVDNGAGPGRFLLAGSATPRPGSGTHSGAGRILSMRMRPMGLHERGLNNPTVSLGAILAGEQPEVSGATDFSIRDYYHAIVSSGFPAVHNKSPRMQKSFLDSYLQRVIDRDLPEQGYSVRRPGTLRRWLKAYAAASSTTSTQKKILDVAGEDGERPARSTANAYREFLTKLWLLDPVEAWNNESNPFKQLQTVQKHQLADPALAARLMNLTARGLTTPPAADRAGKLFESLVTLTVRVIAEAHGASVGHLRSYDNREEIDLIVEGDEGQIIGIEAKLSPDFRDHEVRHLKWLREKMPDDVVDLMVISTGSTAYRRADGIAVVPLALLGC